MKLLLVLLTLMLLASCGTPMQSSYPQSLPPPSVLQRSLRSTVALISQSESGDSYVSCSGVFVRDRIILTAAHCVAPKATVQTPLGRLVVRIDSSPVGEDQDIVVYSDYVRSGWQRKINFEIVAYDSDKDLALLRYDDTAAYDATVARFSSVQHKIGTELFTVGHPAGIPYNVTTGFMSARISRDSGVWRLYSSVPVFRGNSGGPIFDMSGQVVGICSQYAGTAHLNRSIYLRSIHEFLGDSL